MVVFSNSVMREQPAPLHRLPAVGDPQPAMMRGARGGTVIGTGHEAVEVTQPGDRGAYPASRP